MFSLNKIGKEERNFLLKLARESISHFLEKGEILILEENKVPFSSLKENGCCFVTLKIDNQLRGCIGRLYPSKSLYQEVIENAVNAAFFDSRFLPLKKEELKKIKIEISLLSLPENLSYQSKEDLLKILAEKKPGVIIEKNGHLATFLPQVWEELPQPSNFLNSLCLKAGLPANIWEKEKINVKIYQVERIEE